MMDARNVAY
jgi:hypothetical protein